MWHLRISGICTQYYVFYIIRVNCVSDGRMSELSRRAENVPARMYAARNINYPIVNEKKSAVNVCRRSYNIWYCVVLLIFLEPISLRSGSCGDTKLLNFSNIFQPFIFIVNGRFSQKCHETISKFKRVEFLSY